MRGPQTHAITIITQTHLEFMAGRVSALSVSL